MSLEGLVAIVTGAGSGMGRAIALSMASQGARVLVTDIQKSPKADGYDSEMDIDTETLIRKNGGVAEYRRVDVTVAADVEDAVVAAVELFGRLDIIVNNAGTFTRLETIVDQSEEDYDRTMAVKAKGVFLACKYAIKQMMIQPPRAGGQRGVIINIASVGTSSGLPMEPAYCASKGAVLNLTRQVAVDFGPHNIRSNAILPGVFQTAMSRAPLSDQQTVDHPRQFNTFPRFGTVDDMAASATFLASDSAGYINGAALAVDGGFLAF